MSKVNSSTTLDSTELYLKKVLPGSIDDVRLQLMDALETVGYDIIEEEPHIVGRRGNHGWASSVASANVLDYARTLTVRLKPINDSSTSVTFDYMIRRHMSKGDHRIIAQEAKTIASISRNQSIETVCSVCETESTDDSRFCRKCGAPLTSEQAEVEVLRLMAEAQAGKTSMTISLVSLIPSALLLLVTFFLNNADLIKPKLVPLFIILGTAGMISSIVFALFGWNRLRRLLGISEAREPHAPRYSPPAIDKKDVRELPPQTTRPASVTEGTTNLLDEDLLERREKEKIPVSNKRVTNDLD